MTRKCVQCGAAMSRVRRSFFERFKYFSMYTCRKCGAKEQQDQWFLFLFSKCSRCPRCGTYGVLRLRSMDKIDPMYKNPISRVQKYFGAPIHWCPFCRLQFYDLRKRVVEGTGLQPVSTAKSDG